MANLLDISKKIVETNRHCYERGFRPLSFRLGAFLFVVV